MVVWVVLVILVVFRVIRDVSHVIRAYHAAAAAAVTPERYDSTDAYHRRDVHAYNGTNNVCHGYLYVYLFVYLYKINTHTFWRTVAAAGEYIARTIGLHRISITPKTTYIS